MTDIKEMGFAELLRRLEEGEKARELLVAGVDNVELLFPTTNDPSTKVLYQWKKAWIEKVKSFIKDYQSKDVKKDVDTKGIV